jgi:cyanate lyase
MRQKADGLQADQLTLLRVIDFDECSNSRVPISPLAKRFEQLLAPASPPGEP